MKISVLFFSLLISSNVYSWGKNGHRIVGHIAEKNLSMRAAHQVKKVLGHETLSQVSNWPDFMKSNKEYRKYGSWHYASIPDGQTYETSKKNKKGDIITAMVHCEDILRNKKSSLEDKQFALKFLVHLVGDVHQPIHVGRKHDKGGNDIALNWFGQKTNLHKIWDTDLIELQKLSYTEYTDYIHHITNKEKKKLQNSYYLDWAHESMSLRHQVYKFKKGNYWEWDYNYKNIKTINRRLLEGGIRLAGLLNDIYSKRKLTKKAKDLREFLKSSK